MTFFPRAGCQWDELAVALLGASVPVPIFEGFFPSYLCTWLWSLLREIKKDMPLVWKEE